MSSVSTSDQPQIVAEVPFPTRCSTLFAEVYFFWALSFSLISQFFVSTIKVAEVTDDDFRLTLFSIKVALVRLNLPLIESRVPLHLRWPPQSVCTGPLLCTVNLPASSQPTAVVAGFS